jgi:hypothetical protein
MSLVPSGSRVRLKRVRPNGRRRKNDAFAYALLWWLATPFAFLRLAWRARRQPGYLERWGERLGFYERADKVPRIWIHAVSLGETRAAAPLVQALGERYPRHRILLTHMTPTGRQAGRELFGDRVERAWLPYDHGFAVRRFLAHFAPEIGIVMETENLAAPARGMRSRESPHGARERAPVGAIGAALRALAAHHPMGAGQRRRHRGADARGRARFEALGQAHPSSWATSSST